MKTVVKVAVGVAVGTAIGIGVYEASKSKAVKAKILRFRADALEAALAAEEAVDNLRSRLDFLTDDFDHKCEDQTSLFDD